MARPEKAAAVKEIAGRFESSEAALLTEYRGLKVGEIAEVRGALRDADADYKVLKNTLTRLAVREVGLEELIAMLEGPVAIAFIKGDAAFRHRLSPTNALPSSRATLPPRPRPWTRPPRSTRSCRSRGVCSTGGSSTPSRRQSLPDSSPATSSSPRSQC